MPTPAANPNDTTTTRTVNRRLYNRLAHAEAARDAAAARVEALVAEILLLGRDPDGRAVGS